MKAKDVLPGCGYWAKKRLVHQEFLAKFGRSIKRT